MKKYFKLYLLSSATLACLQVTALAMEMDDFQGTSHETHISTKQKLNTMDVASMEDNYASLRVHPVSPWQMANFYADYKADLEEVGPSNLTFPQYLALVHKGRSCLNHLKQTETSASSGSNQRDARSVASRVAVPKKAMQGELNVMVLLIDFPDQKGIQPPKYYERMLFSTKELQTGSMRDYYDEVSKSNLQVKGTVYGWLRMPQNYSYYTNEESGMEWDSYPRNAPRMAEDAVQAALNLGISFDPSLDVLGEESITALFLIHAGRGAEVLPKREGLKNIWSHKWNLKYPITVAPGLKAKEYLAVPHDCMVGVCAHELGHLAMGWDDFYDPNYAADGKYWDGSGNWDLMAGGSFGGGGVRPVHPTGLHKLQHEWVKEETLNVSTLESPKEYTLYSFDSDQYSVLSLISNSYTKTQKLLLEYRGRKGFDSELPGEGLLVWRVDTSKEQMAPDFPALLLIQADGKHDLEDGYDNNSGDGADPFPGTQNKRELLDAGNISTSFPNISSGILITNIIHNTIERSVSFKVSAKNATRTPEKQQGSFSGTQNVQNKKSNQNVQNKKSKTNT